MSSVLPPSKFTEDDHRNSSFIDNLKPSVMIIILILSITLLISVSLCLLLRHCNRRCLLRQSISSSSSSSSSVSTDTLRFSGSRVSPHAASSSHILDSLPLFTFSSVTRQSATASSSLSGDCAVCLSKFEPNDQLRLLPLCCHAFHSDCIDAWLVSNQTCPLCRSPLYVSDSDLIKATSAAIVDRDSNGDGSFRIEIGSISRRLSVPESGDRTDRPGSYSVGSFDYVVDEESEVALSNSRVGGSFTEKEDVVVVAPPESSLTAEVGGDTRNWLKDYVDRLSNSISSRAMSFRSSGRFFTGSSRRSEIPVAVELDVEANRAGEEISELFRWISGI